MEPTLSYTAFANNQRIASGPLPAVLKAIRARMGAEESAPILVFEDHTGQQVDFNLEGSLEQVLSRHAPEEPRPGPGRPKLGVVSREVSLLPRHWEWLEQQPQGTSGALRRLVDDARRQNAGAERTRLAIEATSRFLTAMAGNLPHYEEASRALFARDAARFETLIADFPTDIREHLRSIAGAAFTPENPLEG